VAWPEPSTDNRALRRRGRPRVHGPHVRRPL